MYYDQVPDISRRIADYATLAEIETVSRAMRERWKELGHEMRRLHEGDTLQRKLACINRGLKLIKDGELPWHPEDYSGANDILAELHALYKAAQDEATERKRQDIALTPIDDAAWRAELERRDRIDRYLDKR